MKDYVGYIVAGIISVICIVIWIKLSWLIAVIVSCVLSFFSLIFTIKVRATSNTLRCTTGAFVLFAVLVSVTTGKGIGLLIVMGVFCLTAATVAFFVFKGKRGHSYPEFAGGLQYLGFSLLGLKPLTANSQPTALPKVKKQKITITKKRPYRFVGADESIDIAGYTIENPLIYVTNKKEYSTFDASIIHLGRRIAPPRLESEGALGYWPRTSELSSSQMGNYIQWLSGGRQDTGIDLGYVFLFFYGLERRALLDEKDVVPIAIEVIRLLGIYHQSRSFRDYATGLLIHLVMRDWLEATPSLLTQLLLYQDKHISTELQEMLLGHLAKEKEGLPSQWAFMLAQQDERSRRSVVTKRTPEEFENLFTLRFKNKYGDTLCPSLSEKKKTHYYRPASPSLASGYGVQSKVPPATWPTVAGWRRKFAPVTKIYNECIDELKGYAQKSKTQGTESMTAYGALPAELREQMDHPLQDQWDTVIERHSPDDEGMILVPVSELADLSDITFRPKLTLSQSKSLAGLVDTFSTSIEPDVRYTQKPYKWNDYVAILRLPDEPALPQGQTYALVSMLMPLAMEVSRASGSVEPEEVSVIIEFFEERFMLERNDRIRTEALMNVLLNSEMSLQGLKNSISECFTEQQREAIGRFLVIIAGAADGVCKEEEQSLKKTFKALNINATLVQQFIVDLGFGASGGPITVQAAEQQEAGEPIPCHTAALDESKIIGIINDTNQIVDMLVQATDPNNAIPIIQEEPETEESPEADANGIPHLLSLRNKLHPILQELLTRASWQKEEVNELARTHGMTVAAAVDEINEWSYEYMDDMLLEGESTITVNYNILQGET